MKMSSLNKHHSKQGGQLFKTNQISRMLKDKDAVKMIGPELRAGFEALKEMKANDAADVFSAAMSLLIYDVQKGLGFIEDYDDEEEMPVFEMIDDLYEQRAGGCYFCNHRQDINEPFDRGAKLCMDCAVKLGRFLDAIGIPKKKVMPGLPEDPPDMPQPELKEPDGSMYNAIARASLGERIEFIDDDDEPFGGE
jgi:hypothetical protein